MILRDGCKSMANRVTVLRKEKSSNQFPTSESKWPVSSHKCLALQIGILRPGRMPTHAEQCYRRSRLAQSARGAFRGVLPWKRASVIYRNPRIDSGAIGASGEPFARNGAVEPVHRFPPCSEPNQHFPEFSAERYARPASSPHSKKEAE